MTIKKMQTYAQKRGYYFNGEKNYRGFYHAIKEDGSWIMADTIEGLKRLMYKN